ncbi:MULTISPECIES: Xaa-Pro peptidase family protein [unclassified Mycolicibacterium]|uniref:M24 family metallopeptidase n=1 Tax=unclassified Mycolicibacterium TaxID=2636767 RepID=UPI001391C4BE|nr:MULTISPECIES: Xaa-Pro peptidase family protein [unclassified Mycolicibacterium]
MSTIDPTLEAFIKAEKERLRHDRFELPFSRAEYQQRQANIRARMEQAGIDLLMVSSPEAIAWLTGHALRWNKGQSPTAWAGTQTLAIRVDNDTPILFETAEHELMIVTRSCIDDYRLSADESLNGTLDNMFAELKAEGWLRGSVGVERWSYVPNRAVGSVIEERLTGAGCRVVDASLLVRAARRIKSPQELAYIERAAGICDAGLTALEAAIAPGVTELELWVEMMRGMVAAGGEPAALHETVAIGPNDLGHAFAGRRALQPGDYVWADPCGVFNHYHANIATTWYLGDPPPEALRLADIQAGAYDVLADVARDGIAVRDVNHALLDYYTQAGVWGLHGWTGGYELGLSFPPDWVGEFVFSLDDPDVDGVFEAGMVTNYESIVNYGMIDTIVYGTDSSRCLSTRPHRLNVVNV